MGFDGDIKCWNILLILGRSKFVELHARNITNCICSNLDDVNKIFREYMEMLKFLFFGWLLLHLFLIKCSVTSVGKTSVGSNHSSNNCDTPSKFRLKVNDGTFFYCFS